jgi:hypothetical protein
MDQEAFATKRDSALRRRRRGDCWMVLLAQG